MYESVPKGCLYGRYAHIWYRSTVYLEIKDSMCGIDDLLEQTHILNNAKIATTYGF